MKLPQPLPGVIIGEPYVEDTTFRSLKESAGDVQMSKVVACGNSYTDDGGILRECPVKVGDVVAHRYTGQDFDIGVKKYRSFRFFEAIAKI